MLRSLFLLVAFSVLALPVGAQEFNCVKPTPPTLNFDGATATSAQVDKARSDFYAYVNLANEFLQCLTEYEEIKSKKLTPEQRSSLTIQYNAAIDEQRALAQALNTQIDAYNRVKPSRR